MINRLVKAVPIACLAVVVCAPATGFAQMNAMLSSVSDDGIVKVKSAYPMSETITRLKKDVADKGIKSFIEIDQSRLAADKEAGQ